MFSKFTNINSDKNKEKDNSKNNFINNIEDLLAEKNPAKIENLVNKIFDIVKKIDKAAPSFKKHNIINETHYYEVYPLDKNIKEILDYFRSKTYYYNEGVKFLYDNGKDVSIWYEYFNILSEKETDLNYNRQNLKDFIYNFSQIANDFFRNLYFSEYPKYLSSHLSWGDQILEQLDKYSAECKVDNKYKAQLQDFIKVYQALGLTNKYGPVTKAQIKKSKKVIDAYYIKHCQERELEAKFSNKTSVYNEINDYINKNRISLTPETTPEDLNKIFGNYPENYKDILREIIPNYLLDYQIQYQKNKEIVQYSKLEKDIETKFINYIVNTDNLEKTLTYLTLHKDLDNMLYNNYNMEDEALNQILSDIYGANTTIEGLLNDFVVFNKNYNFYKMSISDIIKFSLGELLRWRNKFIDYANDSQKLADPQKLENRGFEFFARIRSSDNKKYKPLISALVEKILSDI